MKVKRNILSTKCSLKFANKNKQKQLNQFIQEYQKVLSFFIDYLWNNKNIPSLIPKEITNQANTWITKRAI